MLGWWLTTMVCLALSQASPQAPSVDIPAPAEAGLFTADDFRRHLRLSRGVDVVRDALFDPKLPAEKRRELLDWARKLAEINRSADPDKKLPLPPALLNDPRLKSLAENPKLLEHLASNPAIRSLAEKFAAKFKFPDPPRTNSPLPGLTPPAERFGKEALPPTPIDDLPALPEPEPGPTQGLRREPMTQPTPTSNTDRSKLPFHTPEPGRPEPAKPGESSSWIGKLTERMRELGPLKDSPTLDRVDEWMGDAERVPDRFTPAEPGNDLWGGESLLDSLGSNNWDVQPPIDLSTLSLPPGWDRAMPNFDSLPLPSIPVPSVAPALPGLPTLAPLRINPPTSVGSAWKPLLAIFLLFFSIAVVRWLVDRGLTPSAWRSGLRASGAKAPKSAFDPSQKGSIREWFEYLALARLGRTARPQTHLQVADSLGSATADREAAERLARLYEQARYQPADEPLDPSLKDAAPSDLSHLLGR